jgi:hypothetical protein
MNEASAMSTTWTQMILVLLPVVVGAAIGVVPTAVVERARRRAEMRTRWDTALQKSCVEFTASARRVVDLSEQFGQPPSAARTVTADDLRQEHSRLQTLMAEIRLLAGEQVQLAARLVVRHAWALYVMTVTGSDPRSSEYDHPPRARVIESLFTFYLAARRQLMVPDADGLPPLNPATDAPVHHVRRDGAEAARS